MSKKPNANPNRVVGVMNLPSRMGDRISRAQRIHDLLNGNVNFPNPSPSLATVQANINALQKSQAAAGNKVPGMVDQRNADWEVVKDNLKDWLAMVLAFAKTKPDHAMDIITGAGFQVKKVAVRTKSDLVAKNGAEPGSIILIGRGLPHAAHEWQMSTDQVHWVPLPATNAARTVVSGLTYGSTVFFKHRTSKGTVVAPWTNPVSALVK